MTAVKNDRKKNEVCSTGKGSNHLWPARVGITGEQKIYAAHDNRIDFSLCSVTYISLVADSSSGSAQLSTCRCCCMNIYSLTLIARRPIGVEK